MPVPLALSLAPVALQGIKTLYTALNKPKRPENTELMTTLERQISNNQSDIVNKTLMNNITRNAKSLGSQMYQNQERSLDVMRNKGDLSEGQYAKGLLTAGQGIQAEVGKSQDNALMAQGERNLQMQDRVENARLQLAQMKDAARAQYLGDKQQWGNELMGGILDTATAGFNAAMQGIADKNIQSQVGKILNGRNITDLTPDELTNFAVQLNMIKMGISIPDAVQKVVQPTAALVQGALQPTANTPAPMQLQPATLQAPDLSLTDAQRNEIAQSVPNISTGTTTTPKVPAPAVKPAPVASVKPTQPDVKTITPKPVIASTPTRTDTGKEAIFKMRKELSKSGEMVSRDTDKQIITKYQRKNGLTQTGVLDADTLNKAVPKNTNYKLIDLPSALKKYMKDNNIWASGYGQEYNIKTFQRQNGLQQTGVIDKQTETMLKQKVGF